EVADRYPDEGQPATGDQRTRRGEQPARGVEDGLRLHRRAQQRARSGGAGGIIEAQPQHHRATRATGRAHPTRDAVNETGQRGVDLLRGMRPPTYRALRTDRTPTLADLNGARVTVMSESVQVTAGGDAEHRHECRLTDAGDLADRSDAIGVQLRRGDL